MTANSSRWIRRQTGCGRVRRLWALLPLSPWKWTPPVRTAPDAHLRFIDSVDFGRDPKRAADLRYALNLCRQAEHWQLGGSWARSMRCWPFKGERGPWAAKGCSSKGDHENVQ
eukprot:Skav211736  [mRNA]  locus=scaffold1548:63623:65502:+ [translate_table: standard]